MQQSSQDPYAQLRQSVPEVIEANGKQQYIKPLGFRWDTNRKLWYQSLQEVA